MLYDVALKGESVSTYTQIYLIKLIDKIMYKPFKFLYIEDGMIYNCEVNKNRKRENSDIIFFNIPSSNVTKIMELFDNDLYDEYKKGDLFE